jgi:hypothetical protein
MYQDSITFTYPTGFNPRLRDDASNFMSESDRQFPYGSNPITVIHVRMAQAASLHVNKNITVTNSWNINLVNTELGTNPMQSCSDHRPGQ